MPRLILYLAIGMSGLNAFADHADGGSRDSSNIVICERLLTSNESSPVNLILRRGILGRPYILSYLHPMTSRGLAKMELDPNSSIRALRDLVLVVQHEGSAVVARLLRFNIGGFKTIQRFELPDVEMNSYRFIAIPDDKMKIEYENLQRDFPTGVGGTQEFGIGYHTSPDQEGVRRFISFDTKQSSGDAISSTIVLGIDVPTARSRAEKYSTDLGAMTSDLRTAEGNFRRIHALTFVRVHDDIFDD